MLDPTQRQLYTDALAPPAGFVFDEAIATTYSLDPATLLTLPLVAALPAWRREDADPDPITLLESLRRVAARMTVYAQAGRMHAATQHGLFALLEPVVVEAAAPHGGSFHAKLWLLRFTNPSQEEPLLRLLVLSRNITADRSWDLVVQLEGTPGRRNRRENRSLAELVERLPSFATRAVADHRQQQAARLAGELRRVEWSLPHGYDELNFHVLGIGERPRPWAPPPSDELAIISPFVGPAALAAVVNTTRWARLLVSRDETLRQLDASAYKWLEAVRYLDDAATSDDGEDATTAPEPDTSESADTPGPDTLGLHAKAYILRQGRETVLLTSSANCTDRALMQGTNVELLVELRGRRRAVGSIDTLLDAGSLAAYLVEYCGDLPPDPVDNEHAQAELRLEAARDALVDAALEVDCEATEQRWRLTLRAAAPFQLGSDVGLTAWLLTQRQDRACLVDALARGKTASLGEVALADVTGLVAFGLTHTATGKVLRFSFNLPLRGLDADRDAELIRRTLEDRAGFLRYLLMLLGEDGRHGGLLRAPGKAGNEATWETAAGGTGEPLLEEMTRSLVRDPAQLVDLKETIARLRNRGASEELIPDEFLALWSVFQQVLDETPVP